MTSPEITREVTGRGTRATFAAALRASEPALSSAAVLVSGPVILIAVWWVAFAFELVDKNLLPSPFATLADTWTNIVSGNLLEDFWFTFQRVAYAFLFTTFAGVPVGIVLGVNERVYRSVEFIIDFFRSTPATAMFPLFLLLFGLGDFSNTRHLVRAAGLDPDEDVTLVDLAVPQQVPAVLGGSVDATLSLEPVGSIAAATDGVDRVVINPVAKVIADPFYSGAAVLTTKFITDRPEVARKIVEIIDEATALAMADFDKYKDIIPKYTAIREDQLDLLAKPYLRSFSDLNETDLNSYQAFVDVFYSEGVMKEKMDVRENILKVSDFGGS